MKKHVLMVVCVPENSEDRKTVETAMASLEPYRMGMSKQAEMNLLRFIDNQRYLGSRLAESGNDGPAESAQLEPEGSGLSGAMGARAVIAASIVFGGAGLITVIDSQVRLSAGFVTIAMSVLAIVGMVVAWPLIRWLVTKV